MNGDLIEIDHSDLGEELEDFHALHALSQMEVESLKRDVEYFKVLVNDLVTQVENLRDNRRSLRIALRQSL